jgi:3-oxoacyl-[acyl-carrier protein] reductase
MDLGLKDKVALISGASRGIGKQIALSLAAEGAKLVICARTEETIKAAAAQVEAAGAQVEAVVADAMETNAGEVLVSKALERFGGLDIVVSNVGGSAKIPFAEMSDAEWSEAINFNFMTSVRVARAALPALEKRGGGCIINISSIYGRETGGPLSYNASKAAMISFTSNLAQELAAKNIRVNTIAPGSILFPGGTWDVKMKADPEGIDAFMRASIPSGRFGKAEEVADVVAFVASERASWITGACINVDGGQSRSQI